MGSRQEVDAESVEVVNLKRLFSMTQSSIISGVSSASGTSGDVEIGPFSQGVS